MLGNRQNLVFLKLGGSLITDKRQAETPRLAVIHQMAADIAAALQQAPDLRLVIGHGSGSFGHVFGRRYGTRDGVHTPEQWYGFAATADAAARLNRIVVSALLDAQIPAWSIQPGVALRCADGRIAAGPQETVALALDRGLTPVVFGDVALDNVRGGTIASTEEIFEQLADHLHPQRLVLAGEVDGIYTADPLIDPAAQRYHHGYAGHVRCHRRWAERQPRRRCDRRHARQGRAVTADGAAPPRSGNHRVQRIGAGISLARPVRRSSGYGNPGIDRSSDVCLWRLRA